MTYSRLVDPKRAIATIERFTAAGYQIISMEGFWVTPFELLPDGQSSIQFPLGELSMLERAQAARVALETWPTAGNYRIKLVFELAR